GRVTRVYVDSGAWIAQAMPEDGFDPRPQPHRRRLESRRYRTKYRTKRVSQTGLPTPPDCAIVGGAATCAGARFQLPKRHVLNTRDLHGASLSPAMKAFVERWAAHTGADSVQVVSASDDARLIAEALAAGEIKPV